ncbi:MAG: amino acid racemase [Spirochaetaceae bacterium]|jgi:aspartate racemase|nr:amino acid racemase [Spirochaetaceae bacterium]
MKNQENPIIGIIGGVGPYAGADFFRDILDNTVSSCDQDHLSTVLLSCPALIPDRTDFLLGKESENPASAMFECAKRLYSIGAKYVSVACNTAHSKRIFSPFMQMVQEELPNLVIVNMLETCALHIKHNIPGVKCIGYLATKGTYMSKVYHEYVTEEHGFSLIEPENQGRERIHEAIYSKEFGIKVHSSPVNPKARGILFYEALRLMERGAEAIILGCTELPLAVNPDDFFAPILDPGKLTARRLIDLAAPEKLRR